MPLLPYQGKPSDHRAELYIAPTAAIIGDVTLEDGTSRFGAVLRGDVAPIRVGRNTNIRMAR